MYFFLFKWFLQSNFVSSQKLTKSLGIEGIKQASLFYDFARINQTSQMLQIFFPFGIGI